MFENKDFRHSRSLRLPPPPADGSPKYREKNVTIFSRVSETTKKKEKNRNTIQVKNLIMKEESQCILTDKCFVCRIQFQTIKLDLRHLCKVCGKSICGDCSKNIVNEKRACDLCFTRLTNQKQGLRRKEFLRSKEKSLIDLKNMINQTRMKTHHTQEKNSNMKKLTESERLKFEEQLNQLEKQIEKLDQIFKKTIEKKAGSEKILQNDILINNEAKLQNEKKRNDLQNLKVRLEEKLSFLNLQNERLHDLEEQEHKIAASPSYVEMANESEAVKIENDVRKCSDLTTISFSKKLENMCEDLEKISERNESVISNRFSYANYNTPLPNISKKTTKESVVGERTICGNKVKPCSIF